MRIAPIALANVYDEQRAMSGIWRNAITTHGHPRAILGALVYGKVLLSLLQGSPSNLEAFVEPLRQFVANINLETLDDSVQDWMESWSERTGRKFVEAFSETQAEFDRLLTVAALSRERSLGEIYKDLGCFNPATKGSGTGTVAAAIAVFLKHGRNYESAVLKAVNMLGSDTDTIGAMVGGMVGALKSQVAIPDRWANTMQDYGYFVRVAEALTRIALRDGSTNDLLDDHTREQFENRDIATLAKSRMVHKGQRVAHPILGLGWVEEAHSQQIKRRGGGTMLLAKVAFDGGQSCVFRSYMPAKASQAGLTRK